MKKLNISEEQLKRAEELFEFKKLNNSITSGEGNLAGALGEILVCDLFKGEQQNTYDYDIIIDTKKIDVKTKRFTAKFTPTTNWNLNIPDFNTGQECDYYCFVGMADDYTSAYFYGFIKKNDFYSKAKFGKKGEADPNGNGQWTFRADCYNILISELGSTI
jgi:hypothetical protein